MSTIQFESASVSTNNATSTVGEQNLTTISNVVNTASKWVSSSEHQEQQLAAHIAVHTPIHVIN